MADDRIGKVKFYAGDKGYGFIKSEGEEFFFHISEVAQEGYIPKAEDRVKFTVTTGKRGPKATFVRQV